MPSDDPLERALKRDWDTLVEALKDDLPRLGPVVNELGLSLEVLASQYRRNRDRLVEQTEEIERMKALVSRMWTKDI